MAVLNSYGRGTTPSTTPAWDRQEMTRGARTQCAWVQLPSTALIPNYRVSIISWVFTYSKVIALQFLGNNTTNPLHYGYDFSSDAISAVTNSLNLGWVHFAVVIGSPDYSTVSIYMNGWRIFMRTTTGMKPSAGVDVTYVGVGAITGWDVNTDIAQAHWRVWNTELTQAQIIREMVSPVPVRIAGLLASSPLPGYHAMGHADYSALHSGGWGPPFKQLYYYAMSHPGPPMIAGMGKPLVRAPMHWNTLPALGSVSQDGRETLPQEGGWKA